MNFKPQSEEEVSNLLEKGYADAIILEASDVLSQAGNPMFKMKLRAKDSRGKVVVFFDHVMQGEGRMGYKLRHLAYSAGLGNEYEKGSIPAYALVNKHVVIKTRVAANKNGEMQNVVDDYVAEKPAPHNVPSVAPHGAVVELPIADGDIPF